MKRLVKNSAFCLKCQTEVISRHTWDFVWCPCHNVAVDGGNEYAKRVWNDSEDNWVDTSVYV